MAASCTGMAAIACGVSVTRRAGLNQFSVPSKLALPPRRDARFRVRSVAEEEETKQPREQAAAPPKPTPPPKPKVGTSFTDVLAFSGPGPERINGRLAMIGFVAAMGVEIANGQDIFSQLQNGGLLWFVGTSVLLSLASLIPMFRGVSAESESVTPMTADAEIWNGRFAMLGLVALAFTEYVKGGALVV